jgi:hypothetical protein
MARRKNQPDVVRVKNDLADRLRLIRVELCGERGGSEMARQLGVPVRTWYNYENGVTVPAEVILNFIVLMGVEPVWLMTGEGPKWKTASSNLEVRPPVAVEVSGIETLAVVPSQTPAASHFPGPETQPSMPVVEPKRSRGRVACSQLDMPGMRLAIQENRTVSMNGDCMAPRIRDKTVVAYSAVSEPIEDLEDSLVVAWLGGTLVVRWFERVNGTGYLRAENEQLMPPVNLSELERYGQPMKLRRVLGLLPRDK